MCSDCNGKDDECCPCAEKTVREIMRLEKKKQERREHMVEGYTKSAVLRSKKLGGYK